MSPLGNCVDRFEEGTEEGVSWEMRGKRVMQDKLLLPRPAGVVAYILTYVLERVAVGLEFMSGQIGVKA